MISSKSFFSFFIRKSDPDTCQTHVVPCMGQNLEAQQSTKSLSCWNLTSDPTVGWKLGWSEKQNNPKFHAWLTYYILISPEMWHVCCPYPIFRHPCWPILHRQSHPSRYPWPCSHLVERRTFSGEQHGDIYRLLGFTNICYRPEFQEGNLPLSAASCMDSMDSAHDAQDCYRAAWRGPKLPQSTRDKYR